MTPNQKRQRNDNYKIAKFLGINNYKSYTDVHLRRLIESKKTEILNILGIDLSKGLDPTSANSNMDAN